MTDTITQQLKEIIANKMDVNLNLEEIDENVSLYEGGLGLDSIAIVDLIVAVEREFGITIEDDEMGGGLFRTILTLADFVRTKKNA
ncbi:MAG: acyl carrier protein [bacterium]|nr:acyl carrier protein [bacterium]